MPTAAELLRQGRHADIWKMCCGYLNYSLEQFMSVQKRLLEEQIQALSRSPLGRKIMRGAWPQTAEDFRKEVPLTSYSDYCPELLEKREETLPVKPALWVHTSGRTGEYSCKWIPFSPAFVEELGPVLYGLGLLSASRKWGDLHPFVECPNMIYTVAPRPYVSGALASILQAQTPSNYLPTLSRAEKLPFEERIKLGFEEALSEGLDYFFGLSLVLSAVGEKFNQSSGSFNLLPLLSRPKALIRLTRGMVKSRLAGRHLMPKDIWNVRGIITSGLDSSVYKEKIREYWGRYPLDIYSCTEGGVIATQTWDYGDMTFLPNLNFLEFIPEKEHFKWQMDHRYQPKTVLLDEVAANECYEIVITSFHGGALVRYRIGDMIRITSLKNEKSGIGIPQMVFERRADDLIDFNVIRLTEKSIWQAIERSGVPYEDWVAFKSPGKMVLNVMIEPRNGFPIDKYELERALQQQIVKGDNDSFTSSSAHQVLLDMVPVKVKVTLLPQGAFARFSSKKRAEGADIAHLKPPHINPPQKVLEILLGHSEAAAETAVGAGLREASVSLR
jgi:hypothetical protein